MQDSTEVQTTDTNIGIEHQHRGFNGRGRAATISIGEETVAASEGSGVERHRP
jgi:hypothetical protein